MDIELKVKELELTALDNTTDSPICRAVLNSLWNRNNTDGCNLHTLARAGNETFEAVIFTLQYFHQNQNIGLEKFISHQQISDINKYSGHDRSG